MIWNSWSDFFAMGGYALYVWGSVSMMFGLLMVEAMALRLRRKALLKQYGRLARNARKGRHENEA